MSRRPRTIAALAGVLLASACGSTAGVGPTKDPSPRTPPTASPAAAIGDAGGPKTTPPSEATPTIPVFAREPFAPAGNVPTAAFAIEGGIAVTDGVRVGKVTGETITWVGKIPTQTTSYGPNGVVSIHGRFPDFVGAIATTSEGRAPAPTYFPVTHQGATHTEAPGGGAGDLFPVRVGDTILIAAGSHFDGWRMVSSRGIRAARDFTPAQGTCKAGETVGFGPPERTPALVPRDFQATTEGTLVSVGTLCGARGPAAEVWDRKTGKSRIVDLSPHWKGGGYPHDLVRGSGNELFAFGGDFRPILRFDGAGFTPLPMIGSPIVHIFASPTGILHAETSDHVIHRFAEDRWTPIARLSDPLDYQRLAVDEAGTFWLSGEQKVFRLREKSREKLPSPDDCKNWLVYLFEPNPAMGASYTHPAIRKVLGTLPNTAGLGFVEFGGFPRHLGITVASKAQGEAVASHLKTNGKNLDPKLVCHVPDRTRAIPLDAKR